MTEVVSIRFKNRGKAYYFDPAGLQIREGDSVIVDTANGMEIAVCSRENHPVEDTAVVHPLRRVLRIATQMDLRTEELNRQREKTAFDLCKEKIGEHQLDMKLVDVECNFEGNKTTFFFTSDGRVDFRSLVKDLASILHNRIELRQIGVRDEAKMLGGLGICGRPYCCSQFLDDFHPVSTKMAKIQSLSLNPAKISGSCGRLMCCLRYEQEAYEDLVKKVPKQGAFVETKDGYGTAVQVNLLRSTVKVRLDDDREDVLHEYKSYELAAVPGGRPKDGVEPPHVLEYVEPEAEEPAEEPVDEWAVPTMIVTPVPEEPVPAPAADEQEHTRRSRRSRSRRKGAKPAAGDAAPIVVPVKEESVRSKNASDAGRKSHSKKKPSQHAEQGAPRKSADSAPAADIKPQKVTVQPVSGGEGQAEKKHKPRRRYYHGKKSSGKPSSNS
ncbi:MAG: stage 0 sporulation family protein [Oscillospiraceae bacterium]|nr:stage 0 sporulation family protein [Oscillospiraceae bacterium]